MQRKVKNAGAAPLKAPLREETSEVSFYDSFIRPSSSAASQRRTNKHGEVNWSKMEKWTLPPLRKWSFHTYPGALLWKPSLHPWISDLRKRSFQAVAQSLTHIIYIIVISIIIFLYLRKVWKIFLIIFINSVTSLGKKNWPTVFAWHDGWSSQLERPVWLGFRFGAKIRNRSGVVFRGVVRMVGVQGWVLQ